MKENNLNTTHALDITKHLLVSGIMCYNGCGKTIEKSLNLDEFKQQKLLTPNAQILIDAEPQTLGIHRLTLRILDEEPCDENVQKKIVSSLTFQRIYGSYRRLYPTKNEATQPDKYCH